MIKDEAKEIEIIQCWGKPLYAYCKATDGTVFHIPGFDCKHSTCPSDTIAKNLTTSLPNSLSKIIVDDFNTVESEEMESNLVYNNWTYYLNYAIRERLTTNVKLNLGPCKVIEKEGKL